MLPEPFPTPRFSFTTFAIVAGAAATGAVALYRRLTRAKEYPAVVTTTRGRIGGIEPRKTVVVESDGPVREPAFDDVPW